MPRCRGATPRLARRLSPWRRRRVQRAARMACSCWRVLPSTGRRKASGKACELPQLRALAAQLRRVGPEPAQPAVDAGQRHPIAALVAAFDRRARHGELQLQRGKRGVAIGAFGRDRASRTAAPARCSSNARRHHGSASCPALRRARGRGERRGERFEFSFGQRPRVGTERVERGPFLHQRLPQVEVCRVVDALEQAAGDAHRRAARRRGRRPGATAVRPGRAASSTSSSRNACAPCTCGSASRRTLSSSNAARWPTPSSSSRSTRLVASACCRRCACARWSRRNASMRASSACHCCAIAFARALSCCWRACHQCQPRQPIAASAIRTTSTRRLPRRGGEGALASVTVRNASLRGAGDGDAAHASRCVRDDRRQQVLRTRPPRLRHGREPQRPCQPCEPRARRRHARSEQAFARGRRQLRQHVLQRSAAAQRQPARGIEPGKASRWRARTGGSARAHTHRRAPRRRRARAGAARSGRVRRAPSPTRCAARRCRAVRALPARLRCPPAQARWRRRCPRAPAPGRCRRRRRTTAGRAAVAAVAAHAAARTAAGLVAMTHGATERGVQRATGRGVIAPDEFPWRQRQHACAACGGGATQRRVLPGRAQRDHVASVQRARHARRIANGSGSRRDARRGARHPRTPLPGDAAGRRAADPRRRLRRRLPAAVGAAGRARQRQGLRVRRQPGAR